MHEYEEPDTFIYFLLFLFLVTYEAGDVICVLKMRKQTLREVK